MRYEFNARVLGPNLGAPSTDKLNLDLDEIIKNLQKSIDERKYAERFKMVKYKGLTLIAETIEFEETIK